MQYTINITGLPRPYPGTQLKLVYCVQKVIKNFLFTDKVLEVDNFKAFEGTCLGSSQIENSNVFALGKVSLKYRLSRSWLY